MTRQGERRVSVESEGTLPQEKGGRAPDFTLDQVDGPPVTLSELCAQGRQVLSIFLRYLG